MAILMPEFTYKKICGGKILLLNVLRGNNLNGATIIVGGVPENKSTQKSRCVTFGSRLL
jgi:hypothetical protein